MIRVSQVLVLAAVVVCCWWFGGITALAKVWVGGLLLTALGLFSVHAFRSKSPTLSIPTVPLLVMGLWLVWALLQLIPVPSSVLCLLSPGGSQMLASFRDTSPTMTSGGSISTVPAASLAVVAWHAVLALAFLLSALLFNTESSRRVLLVVIAVNAVLLACWGIVQRSTNTGNLLPGVANFVQGSNPFASFTYKNSGGCAMLLGISALAGLMAHRVSQMHYRLTNRKSSRSHSGDKDVTRYYDQEAGKWGRYFSRKNIDAALLIMTDARVIAIGFGLALATAGIASSLSRGAWVGVATGVGIFAGSFLLRTRAIGFSLVAIAVTLAVALTLVVLVENEQKVMVRVEMLDGETIRNDDRWNHWPTTMRSLIQYAPFGSGLGTYGYASLPFQKNKVDGWYKQAHNQYLETAVESGLPGIVLLAIMLVLFVVWGVRLIVSSQSPEKFAWGALVCVAVLGVAVQAFADFVITTPANGLVFLVLMGAASTVVAMSHTSSQRRWGSSPKQTSRWDALTQNAATRTAWVLGIALPVGLFAQWHLSREWRIDSLLSQTELPNASQAPTETYCREMVAKFEAQPTRVQNDYRVARRMGDWNELLFRSIILQSMTQSNAFGATANAWNATHPYVIFGAIYSTNVADQRKQIIDTYLEPAGAKEAVESALASFTRSIQSNPFVTPVHIARISLMPIVGQELSDHLQLAYRIAGVSSDQLFSIGLMACFTNDVTLMNQAWSQSMAMNSKRLVPIMELALTKESDEKIVSELLPAQPSLLVTVSQLAEMPLSPKARTLSIERAAGYLDDANAVSDLTMSSRLKLQARIAEIQNQWTEAKAIYEQLVRLESNDASIRFRYANALLQLGDTKEAWTQTNTGATLNPADPTSEHLFQQIERARKQRL